MNPQDALVAAEAIRQVKARYFRCVDTKDWRGLAQVFTEDAVFDRTYGHAVRDPVSGAWSAPISEVPILVHGRGAIMDAIRRAVETLATVHQGFMPEIAFDDDGHTAHGTWAMSDELRDRTGRLILAGRGHYHDSYRLTAQGWRIARSQLTRLSLIHGDGQRD
jgi:hypothetical protein